MFSRISLISFFATIITIFGVYPAKAHPSIQAEIGTGLPCSTCQPLIMRFGGTDTKLHPSWMLNRSLSEHSHAKLGSLQQASYSISSGVFIPVLRVYAILLADITNVVSFIGASVRLSKQQHAPFWGTFGIISSLTGILMHTLIIGVAAEERSFVSAMPYHIAMLSFSVITFGLSIATLVVGRKYRIKRRYIRKATDIPPALHKQALPKRGVFILGNFQ